MNTLIHADIFFFVSTICLVIVTVFLIIALTLLIKTLSDFRYIADRTRTEGDFFLNELHRMGERMRARRFGIGALFIFIRRLIRRYS